MNYKEVTQYLNFPDHLETRSEWEYMTILTNNLCYNIQEFADLITAYGVNINELKLSVVSSNQAAVIFKKGGSFREDFPGQVIIAEYTEDTLQEEQA